MKDTREIFAERLSVLLAEKLESGEKIAGIAREIGISSGSLSQYQNGKVVASIDAAAKIAKYFGVSTDYLLGLTQARTNDGDVRKVCDTTGLDVTTIDVLSNMHRQPDNEPTTLILNYIIQNGDLLQHLVDYFSSAFESELKQKPLSYIAGNPRLRDGRLFYADVITALERNKDKFKSAADKTTSRKMALRLAERAVDSATVDGWKQIVHDYAKGSRDNNDRMVKAYAEFLDFYGLREHMKWAGVKLEELYGTD